MSKAIYCLQEAASAQALADNLRYRERRAEFLLAVDRWKALAADFDRIERARATLLDLPMTFRPAAL